MPLQVFLEELELAPLRILRKLPAVMGRLLGARAALALEVRDEVRLDALAAIRGRADEEEGLPAPEHVDAAPLVRRVLHRGRGERPLRAPQRHSDPRNATVVP